MDQGSMPPGGSSERPTDDKPPQGEEQPSSPSQREPSAQPPGFAPPSPYGQQYAPPPGAPPQPGGTQGYPPPGYQSPGYQPPQGYPPPGYQPPQGAPPQGYPPPGYQPPGYPPPGYAVGPPKKSGMPVWGWILIGVGVFLIIVCAGSIATLTYLGQQVNKAFSSVGSQVTTDIFSSIGSELGSGDSSSIFTTGAVLVFYDDLDSGNYEGAHGSLSGDLASRYSADQLRAEWEAFKKKAGSVSTGMPSEQNVTNDTATLTEELTDENGQTYRVNLTLKKQDALTWTITKADPSLIPAP